MAQSRPKEPADHLDHADSHRGGNAWRGPGRRATARNRRIGHRFRPQAIVIGALSSGLRSESAGLATPPLHFMVGRSTPLPLIGGRRNRRAPGASAGGKSDGDGCSHPEPADFLPVAGDRTIAGGSAVNLRHCRINSAALCVIAPLRLCVNSVAGQDHQWSRPTRRGSKRTSVYICVICGLFPCSFVSLKSRSVFVER